MNAYEHFARSFRRAPDAPFLEDEEGRITTYRELDHETARVARFLTRLGLLRGARIAAQIDKSLEGVFLYLGAIRAGFSFVPLNTAYQTKELEYLLGDSRPELFVCRPETFEAFAGGELPSVPHVLTLGAAGEGTLLPSMAGEPPEFSASETDPRTPAVVVYTSGTTGRSKGALVTHGNLTSNADALGEAWGVTEADVLIHALPIFHVHGLFVALHPLLLAHGKILFQRRFDPARVLAALGRATLLMGVPTFYTRLLAEPDLDRERCGTMRLFVSGSAPLRVDTFEAFEARTGHRILERYGMSEAGMITSNPLAGERRPGTVGKPLPGVSLRVVDAEGVVLPPGAPGAVEIQGPNVFAGYLGSAPGAFADFTADGYFKTGDLGVLSADGYLSIVGRSKDLIISGGYNVYPKEIELVIDAFDEVAESAVVGVADPDLGEAVTAVVVRKSGSALLEAELIRRLKATIAGYKVPKRVHFVDALPRNLMGKVEKAKLRSELASGRLV